MKHGFNSEVGPEFSLTCHIFVKVNLRISNSKFSTARSMIYDGPYIRNYLHLMPWLFIQNIALFWLAQIRWLIFWLDLLKNGYRNFSQISPEYFLQNVYQIRCSRYCCRLSWANLTTPRARGQNKLRFNLHVI